VPPLNFSHCSQKIAVKQAFYILLASFLFGAIYSVVQIYFDLHEERIVQVKNISRSIDVVQESIERAIYNLDKVLAHEVLDDLTTNPLIKKALIYDDFGDLLASKARKSTYSPNVLNDFSVYLLGIPLEQSIRMEISSDKLRFARLDIVLDKNALVQDFTRRVFITVSGALLITLLLSGVFLIVSYHFLSKPIVKIENWVKQLKDEKDVEHSPYKDSDELGSLVNSFRQVWLENKASANELSRVIDQLTVSEQFSRLIMDNSNDSMFLCLPDTSIYQVNKQAEAFTGFSSDSLSNRSLSELSNLYSEIELKALFTEIKDDKCIEYEDVFLFDSQKGRVQKENSQKGSGVEPRYIECRASFFEHNGDDFILVNARDVTERTHANSRIHQLAYYDSLTHLANRRLLLKCLDDDVREHVRSQLFGVVMYFDLDRFKNINDSMGHAVGDKILCEAAERISNFAPANATCGRLGGDEFVLVVPNLGINNEDAATHALILAKNLLSTLSEPMLINEMYLYTTISIGLALFPGNSISAVELVSMADTAMYRAKSLGRNSIQFFDREMQYSASRMLKLEEGIHHALSSEHLELWMQPQTDINGCVYGAEALVRWNDPLQGIIAPGDFIPYAEESGLIIDIDKWVVRESFRILQGWLEKGIPQTFKKLSINVSPVFFQQVDFVTYIFELLDEYQVSGDLIQLEITENMLLNNFDCARGKMQLLAKRGVSFAIDDFGTGYSSLRYLKELPLKLLKIDRSFVIGLTDGSDTMAIVEVVIATARRLGLEVIAEGVETKQQLDHLVTLGCHQYQGYFFGRPLFHQLFFDNLKKQY
jgi:diguanylate cyclase (GGDEF)-like protein/PAS domain S-box-containing protein